MVTLGLFSLTHTLSLFQCLSPNGLALSAEAIAGDFWTIGLRGRVCGPLKAMGGERGIGIGREGGGERESET